jgi:hypothetical protein
LFKSLKPQGKPYSSTQSRLKCIFKEKFYIKKICMLNKNFSSKNLDSLLSRRLNVAA